MKHLDQRFLVLFCLMALPICAQVKYPAKITVEVVDDTGAPVTAGKIRVSTFSKWNRGEEFGRTEYDAFEGPIGENGIAVVEMRCLRSDIGYWPILDRNFYSGGGGEYFFKEVVNGRWEPWNPRLKVVVPRILEPIALYARKSGFGPDLELPNVGPIGFDLLVSDWVAPHGKGKLADLIFTHQPNIRAAHVDAPFDSVFTIAFANRGDGIQSRLAKPGKRLLELPRKAPEEGYAATLERRVTWGGQGTNMQTGTREDQNYFLRVRTVLDPDGKVISALYGKIYGDIRFFAPPMSNGMVRFTYYLNPTPLDRNLEFDPKRNLFPDTLSGVNVSEP